MRGAAVSDTEIDKQPTGTSLRDLLADYDTRVRDRFRDVADQTTGTGRVQALHLLGRVLTVHDSVVGSTLCPLLQDLPGGPEVAARLREGCEHRESLLARFQSLSQGTEARNVYPMFGAEIEAILSELERSFDQHVGVETTRVSELLESAATSIHPEVVAARMAIDADRAPGRAHAMAYRHPKSRALRAVYRGIDRVHDWNDTHHGWPSRRRRETRSVRPPRRYDRPPSITDLLTGYDRTVEALVAELAGQEGPKRAAAAYRLAAAVAVHDAIVGGTLCPLLEAVPEGRPAAATLQSGCRERAAVLEEWNELTRHGSPAELFRTRPEEANELIDKLTASFRVHETSETEGVSAAIEQLRKKSWKFVGTGLISPYLLPDWPNPEPGVLAAHMALWAERAPTHSHPLLSRHPTNRLLRDFYHHTDRLRDWRRSRHGWPRLV